MAVCRLCHQNYETRCWWCYTAQRHSYRGRKYGVTNTLTGVEILAQYQKQNGKCFYCDVSLSPGNGQTTIDHCTPMSQGGGNTAENIVVACWPCNFQQWTLSQRGTTRRRKSSTPAPPIGQHTLHKSTLLAVSVLLEGLPSWHTYDQIAHAMGWHDGKYADVLSDMAMQGYLETSEHEGVTLYRGHAAWQERELRYESIKFAMLCLPNRWYHRNVLARLLGRPMFSQEEIRLVNRLIDEKFLQPGDSPAFYPKGYRWQYRPLQKFGYAWSGRV